MNDYIIYNIFNMSKFTKSPAYHYLAIYNSNGEFHSYHNNPAVLRSFDDDSMAYVWDSKCNDHQGYDQFWMDNGLKHRDDDMPAVIENDYKIFEMVYSWTPA